MDVLLGLLSLSGLSLFLARFLRRSASLTPLLAVALAMLWFTLFGCAGLLVAAGWLWYALCAAALVFVLVKEKEKILQRMTPGFLFFVAGGVFFVTLFAWKQPLFTEWDDFTFWGTAAKAVFEHGEMYTTADSNLLHRSYPPGLIMLSYMGQFFGGAFAEYKMMAAYSFVYLAAFSAASAFWGGKKAAALCFLGGLLLLPFFFEPGAHLGQTSWAYHTVMADLPMAAMFGGILCFYFAGGEKDWRMLLPFGVLLAALTNMKDMGFALALLALFIAGLDLVFCERDRLSFFRFKGWAGLLLAGTACAVCVVGAYLVWAGHLALSPIGVDRFNLGSAGESLGMGAMLLTAVGALFGLVQHPQYSQVQPMMLRALWEKPVSVAGSGVIVFALIGALLLVAFLLAATRRQRRRVLVFFLTSTVGFVLFYIFQLFLYAFIFKEVEALILKDYLRYISPYWQGWLMASLVLLGLSATTGNEERLRVQVARAVSLAASGCLLLAVALRGNPESNFLYYSPSHYVARWDVKKVLGEAGEQGLGPGDTVYLLSQGDDGGRSYLFRYEMQAKLALQYYGELTDEEGQPVTEDGRTVYRENVGSTIVEKPQAATWEVPYPAAGGPEELAAFLRQEGCTHFLIDRIDGYFIEAFSELFEDGLGGWSDDDSLSTGHRYYEIVYEGDTCRMVPTEGGAEA
ncbi:hypothetical protein LJC49_00520 [Ruminococcaceae bacterium OttesenSCG-928-I18]|nr:hypothetical protein [Ruminococcaceae bacterium OttesenSCG-928-I18]